MYLKINCSIIETESENVLESMRLIVLSASKKSGKDDCYTFTCLGTNFGNVILIQMARYVILTLE